MLLITILAFGLGLVAGLRTFTPIAAVLLARGDGFAVGGLFATAAALFEYYMDTRPATPSRTQPVGLVARVLSGAFAGWMIATMHGGPIFPGVIAGVAGAIIGAYGGLAGRLAAISRFGAYPAALLEDAVAIVLAVVLVTR